MNLYTLLIVLILSIAVIEVLMAYFKLKKQYQHLLNTSNWLRSHKCRVNQLSII
ncbi:MAG: hypothetical protein HQK75_10680 [Candidatus Magnetomorum sp.]|nr:hypothetical protein [Candidatus Magnetomorum sp.]